MTTVSEEWLARYWPALAVPVASCIVVGMTIDHAFTFVAFMLLCLVLPFVMMMLYFNYALTPEATMAVRSHALTADAAKGIDVTFEPDRLTGRKYKSVHLDWSDVSEAEIRSTDVVLRFHDRNYRYIIIPYSAFPADGNQDAFVKRLHQLLHDTGKIKSLKL